MSIISKHNQDHYSDAAAVIKTAEVVIRINGRDIGSGTFSEISGGLGLRFFKMTAILYIHNRGFEVVLGEFSMAAARLIVEKGIYNIPTVRG